MVEAATPTDLVGKLKDDGRFTADQSSEEHMRAFALRIRDYYGGEPPRTDSPDHFIADLLAQGWLKEVSE